MADNNTSFLESLFNPSISEAYRLPAIDGLPSEAKSAPVAEQPQPEQPAPTTQTQAQPKQEASQPAARGLMPTRADVIRRAQELDVDPALALSFFRAESSGNFNIRDSNKGAVGGFQVMPGTYKQMMGTADGIRDPWRNMEAGLRYMAYGQKVLGTRDPALLAAGYHAGYGSKELKRGEIPDTHDGLMSTRDYARKVARGAGAGVDAGELRTASSRTSSSDDAGRFVPLGADEIKRLGLDAGDDEAQRYVPLSAAEVAAFETDITAKKNEPGLASDLAQQLSGGFYKGVGYLARGAGKIPQLVGDYTTTPLVNKVFGTNFRTGNVLDSTADALAGVGDKIQQHVSSETKSAIQQSTPDGNLFEPSTWTFGAKPSLRGYLALGTDVLGGMLPVIAATVATGGASSAVRIGAGASVGGAQGGGGAVDDARQAIDKMAKDGTLEKESAYYRELLAQGKSPSAALQTTRDAAEKVAFLLTTPVSAAGGAATAKLLHPAEKLFVGRNVAVRAAGRGALSGLEEGTQEAGEKIQTNQGINVGAGTRIDPMQGTFGDFVLGAVAGAAPGAVAGGFSKRESRAPAPQAAPAPVAETKAAGPLGRAVEKVAEDQAPQPARATVASAEGQVSGTVQAYQEDGQGGFQAQILGDDGQVYTFSDKDGVQIAVEQPEVKAGPLTTAVEQAAVGGVEAEAAAAVEPGPAAVPDAPVAVTQEPVVAPTISEQAAAQVARPPFAERAKVEADLSAMSEPDLRKRLKFIATQAKNNGGMNKMLVAERKRVEKEINARVEAAKAAEPAAEKAAPVAEPVKTSFDTIQDANAAMLAAAERTGAVHEVAEQDGKFIVRPIQETANASDERGRSAGPDVRVEPADGKRADADGRPAGERPAAAAEPGPQADAVVAAAGQPADQQPALAKKPKTISQADAEHLFGIDKKRDAALKRIAKGTAFFGTAAKAKDYIAKSGLKESHTVEQTGKVRFEVKAKVAEGMERFPAESGTLGVPRAEMPQIPTQSHGALVNHLNAQGIEHETKTVPASELTPTQAEFSPAKVERAKQATSDRAVIVSNDGHIIDGHHQVLAAQADGKTVKAIVLDAPVGQALDAVKNSPSAQQAATDQAAVKQAEPSRHVIRTYTTKSGKTGAVVTENVGRDGRTTYSYTGEWGAGSGLAAADMQKSESLWQSQKRGFSVSEATPAAVGKSLQAEAESDTAAAEPAPAAKAAPAVSQNTIFTEDAAAKARARLKAKLSQLNSGIDPEMMLDGVVLAGYHIEKGARTFSAFAKAMVADLGEAVKPYLKSWYMGVKYDPRAAHLEGLSSAAEVESATLDEGAVPDQAITAPAAEVVQSAAVADTKAKEKNHDAEPTARNTERGTAGNPAAAVQADDGGGDAGHLSGQLDLAGDPVGGRSAPGGDQRRRQRGQSGLHRRSGAAGADTEQPIQGGARDRAGAGDRSDPRPVSGAGSNYRIAEGELTREGSWAQTADRNLDVVELVKTLDAEQRLPTDAERGLMAKFTGWGASEIANGIFPNQYGQYKSDAWRQRGERLKALLSADEYDAARRTTQYAHYTSEGVIRSIYRGLDRLGLKGGSIVEPGMGVGAFVGLMPDGIAANSHYTGIEYEAITAAIAKHLYPQSNITHGDFTKTALPKDFFDAAIGNPPFSSTLVLNDPEYKALRPMLHDYFFMKTIDRVKPGAPLVFVTSKGTLDKVSDKSRKYLAERANLLGAIRLPQTAFQANAGTEVVTDVIFLQKKGDGIPDNGINWLNTKEISTPQGATSINEYFADRPEMVLGTHALQGSMYRANEYTVLPLEGDIERHFAKAVERLPESVLRPARGSLAERALVADRDFNPKHKKEGGLYLSDDGKLMQVEDGSGVAVEFRTGADGKRIALTPKQKKWLRGYVGVRDALKQAQYDQLNDGAWEQSLQALNQAYDAFVKEHGQILDYTVIERTDRDTGETVETKRFKNEPLLRLDVEGALAYALENVKEDGSIVKGAALNERVLERPREPEIKTTNDAMFVSLNRNGVLDLDDVARLAGSDRASVIRDLGTAIYEAPGAGWQLADEYLSGNVVRKLKEAQASAEIDPKYRRNVEALLAVQPRPLGPTEITVRLGANWVPPTDISNFATDVLGERISVAYSPITGNWNVEQHSFNGSEFSFNKMSAGDILAGVLNARQLKVTFRDQEGKTHVDLEATEKANDIAGKMRERFRTWIWTDTARADRLLKHYNEHFNNIAPRQFDGSHLTLPGVSSRFKLYPHQKRAIWRVIQQGDVYLAHAVGAGKTIEMIAAGMEERRLGLVNKPMYGVPNHMLAQFSRDFLELYPAANIMVADEHNFHTHNRKRFVAQAALNNPDAIVITHAAFGRIAMSDDYANAFIQRQIDDWKAALDDVDESDRVTVKQIERRIEQLERRLEGKQGKDKKDRVLDFEELGVDKLYVDEFHEFRKLDFPTNQGNVKGIDPNGSQRALDLYMKTEYLRGKKPGRAMVAASGTPVTNTMGELFTVQRFFQPEQMKEDGLDSFDAWSAQYGDIVTGFEQNAAGGYDMVARFAKFQNVPELMRRVRSFMDILTGSSLGALVRRPDVAGGGRQVVVTPVPDGYKEYQQQLQGRIQAIRNRKGPPKKGDDIILAVIGDGRFSAIDMRFVDPSLPADPNSKLNQMLEQVIADYHATADFEYTTDGVPDPIKGASHIVFTDIGLGEQSAASRGFDMKAWIEQRFADAGIPREHVAFMRDHKQHAKKERLYADMREGKRRILIGGKDMETGVNVQKRLISLDHLDAPWFPASVEQREGRPVRQGNQNKKVKIRAWATKGSYDSTMWGMNARKARFIEQAMNGDDSVRSLDDVSEASAFEMASALASGDERYLRLAGLKTEVERLERLRHAHFGDQNSARREKHWYEETVKRNTERAKELQAAIERRMPIRAGEFLAHVGKQPFSSREEFSSALFDAFKREAAANFSGDKVLGQIGGFDITFFGEPHKHGEYVSELYVQVPGADPILAYPIDPQMAVAGIATRAANQVNGMDRQLADMQATIETSRRKAEQFGKRLGAAFPEEAILLDKLAELNALQAELAAEGEPSSADAAAVTVDSENDAPDAGPRFSVAPEPDEATMRERIAAAAELFQLPTSDKDTVEGIAADNDPRIQVKKLAGIPGETRYTFTLPNGNTARLVVRPYSDYGPALYGYDMVDGEMQAITAGRPGKNGQAMDGRDDVWIDVSLLSPGSGYGAMIYNIAATYAHNTGKVFIGDPAGLSDEALQRRPEMMLSSALKFGTTEHLAPHPRQVQGDPAVGVPPLAWVYGDHAGNIEKLAKVNLANIEHAGGIGGIRYNKETNTFEDSDGNPLTRADIDDLGSVGLGRAAQAGGRTLARHAVMRSLLPGGGGQGRDAGQSNGILGAFFQLLRDHDPGHLGSPLQRILYSSRPVPDSGRAQIASQAEDAIAGLMRDQAGEATVSHPTLGQIAIPYGDQATGLQHIVRRRGREFLQRIPALLASGQVYTKPGQNGRIFIGNQRDEAALRLDWNGQDKTWLLSAYEKYPDLKPAARSQAAQEAASGLNVAGLQSALTKGALGPVVRAMVDSGIIVLHDTTKTLPKGLGRGVRGVQAVTAADGKVHLVASALSDGNARAVMLHELFHRGGERVIGSEQWGQLMGRLGSLYRQGEQSSGRAREFFDQARARVAAAKRQGAVATRMEVEEFAAYAIEEYESAPAAVRKWVDDLIGMIKAWLVKRFGKQIGQVTPAQLAALAKMALMDVAADHRGQMFGPIGELFSVADPVNSPAFKRWFGDSKVVDADGKPLVVYHGTQGDFNVFDRKAQGRNVHPDDFGFFFTNYKEEANSYAESEFDNKDPVRNVMPVFLSIKNPKNVTLDESDEFGHESPAAWYDEKGQAAARQAEEDGHDGLIIIDGRDYMKMPDGTRMKMYVTFDPKQIKSATGNNGDFDPANPDIRYSVSNMDAATADPSLLNGAAAASPADQVPRNQVSDPETGFTPPEQGMLRRLQSTVQDNMNRLKQVQQRIARVTGVAELGKADYYLAETNRPGRVAARLEDAERQLTGPLMAKLAKSGHTPVQLEELLHAMHAEERNARVALINPQHDPESDDYSGVQGSGMNDDEAQAILAKYAGNRELRALAQQARDIARATLDLKHAYGLLDDVAYEALTKAYDNYVPLKGDGEFGPKVKRAMGHGEREEHILQNLARDYEQAVVVGEKNLARQSLLRLVLEFKDEALWTARVPPRGRYVAGQVYNIVHRGETVGSFVSRAQVDAFLEAKGDKAAQYEVLGSNGDRVQEFVKPLQDHEVMVYVKGEPVRLQFKDAKLAAQLRPLDQGKMHPILEFMRGMNRYLSKIYTGYNPAFILRNAARDAMTGTVNMLGNEGALVAASAWRRYPQALAALGRWAASGKTPDSQTGRYLNEYRMHGGKVGASWLSDLEEQGKTLNRMYEDAYGAAGYLRDGQNLKAAKVAGRKIVGGMAHVIEIANQATENALRLALFMALRERGASPGKAAQAAKQVTVDFDRKGTATGALGGIYLFFNPAVQGTANAFKTLTQGKYKGQAFAALGSLALLGLYAAAQGMDDDRDRWLGQGWDVRTRNFILHVGDKQIRVPLSQEFAPIYALGVALAEAGRGESKMTSAVRLLSSFLDAYFPLNNAFNPDSDNHALDAVLAATPTLLQPAAQSASNRNAFGSQIVPESEFTKARPDNLKMFRGTKNTAYDQAAQQIATLGELFGAGKYENDLTKVSPETLKLMWRTYTGGLGQFVTDSIGVASMAATDAGQLETSDIPIVKDFYRNADVKPVRSRYYDLAREAKAAATEFAQAKKAGDGEAMDKILSGPKSDIIGLGRLVANTNKAAAALRDFEVDINADKSLTPAEKRAQLKALEKEEEALYRGAIGAFK